MIRKSSLIVSNKILSRKASGSGKIKITFLHLPLFLAEPRIRVESLELRESGSTFSLSWALLQRSARLKPWVRSLAGWSTGRLAGWLARERALFPLIYNNDEDEDEND